MVNGHDGERFPIRPTFINAVREYSSPVLAKNPDATANKSPTVQMENRVVNRTLGFGPYTLLPPHIAMSRTPTKNTWTKCGAAVAPDAEVGSQGVKGVNSIRWGVVTEGHH